MLIPDSGTLIFIQLVKPEQVSAGAFHREKGKKLNKNRWYLYFSFGFDPKETKDQGKKMLSSAL